MLEEEEYEIDMDSSPFTSPPPRPRSRIPGRMGNLWIGLKVWWASILSWRSSSKGNSRLSQSEYTIMSSKESEKMDMFRPYNEKISHLRKVFLDLVYLNRALFLPLYWITLSTIIRYLIPSLNLSWPIEFITLMMALNVLVISSYNLYSLESEIRQTL